MRRPSFRTAEGAAERRASIATLWVVVLSSAPRAACGEAAPTPLELPSPGLSAEAGSPALDAGSLADADLGANEMTGLTPHQTRVSLLDHLAWSRTAAEDDPFGDAPDRVYCVETATGPELLGGEFAYGVDTLDCNYVTVQQTTLEHVARGEILQVKVAHFDLTAPSDSEAHLVVRLGELTLFDERVPIPSPSAVRDGELVATQDIPAGTALYFHVHNHGENSYALVSVTAGPSGPED